jgi:hypothetical protein
MRAKKIIFLFLLTTVFFGANCQDMGALKQGISIGYDFSGLIIKLFQPTQTSGELSLTAGAFKKLYYTVEAGLQKINDKETNFNYLSNGQYIKGGFDYNFYKRKRPEENNMVFLGVRYGLASMNHSANNITIESVKWGNYTMESVPETKVKAQWIELVGGIRVELIRNFSMGWSGRVHFLTSLKSVNKPFMIPGFGSGYSSTTIGFNYSIYYTFPIRKYPRE